jgi:hypothetical protein
MACVYDEECKRTTLELLLHYVDIRYSNLDDSILDKLPSFVKDQPFYLATWISGLFFSYILQYYL